jgi:hypothetical protein
MLIVSEKNAAGIILVRKSNDLFYNSIMRSNYKSQITTTLKLELLAFIRTILNHGLQAKQQQQSRTKSQAHA